ncbi:hypothetical protein C8A00DRAFT_18261, partial [Chaetomidium leptoderma]
EADGLLVQAYFTLLNHQDENRAWRYVHQAPGLIQYCLEGERDDLAGFFEYLVTDQAREVLEQDVARTFQQLKAMATRDAEQVRLVGEAPRVVEQFQLYSKDGNSSVSIQVPPAGSEARATFEAFAPGMRAALESGSLDAVNTVLGEMEVGEAENLVGLLTEVSSLPGLLVLRWRPS